MDSALGHQVSGICGVFDRPYVYDSGHSHGYGSYLGERRSSRGVGDSSGVYRRNSSHPSCRPVSTLNGVSFDSLRLLLLDSHFRSEPSGEGYTPGWWEVSVGVPKDPRYSRRDSDSEGPEGRSTPLPDDDVLSGSSLWSVLRIIVLVSRVSRR